MHSCTWCKKDERFFGGKVCDGAGFFVAYAMQRYCFAFLKYLLNLFLLNINLS